MSLLSVENLNVHFTTNDGDVHAVKDVSFNIEQGQKLALVGESGSGKSQIAFSTLGLLAKNGRATGAINYQGEDLLKKSEAQMNKIRAKEIAMIFQDPMSSLNPYMKIVRQMSEVLEIHEGLSRKDARARVLEVLDAVKISDAKNRANAYPHEFSGGMRQRIVIAMALLCKPKLILADEPTTALDVTVQAQIMELLNDIQRDFGSSILLITHDLGVVAGFCDDVMVLYDGQVMEQADTKTLFENPAHPYTRGLLRSVPNIKSDDDQLYAMPDWKSGETEVTNVKTEPRVKSEKLNPNEAGTNILTVKNLRKDFQVRKNQGIFGKTETLRAVNDISFELEAGKTLGIVGESGSGKSTLIRSICGLVQPTSGEVYFKDQKVDYTSPKSIRDLRSEVQMIFQDPLSSLNPRMTIGTIVEEPLKQFFPQMNAQERKKRLAEIFDRVRISPNHINRYPHEFSGGQCQRIGIARALICDPKLLVCDEPVSALDVSIQAQVVNLLRELQREMNLTIIFISHDLSVVRHISDEILVMYLGSMMEFGEAKQLIDNPQHPYTQCLISAIPIPDPNVKVTPQFYKGEETV